MKSMFLRLSVFAFALGAGLSPVTHAQQPTPEQQKELEAARADLQRAAKRVDELSRKLGVERSTHIKRRIGHRPVLGVLLAPDSTGVRITGVTPDSGAAKAGLKAGDQLLTINGRPIAGTDERARLASARAALAELKTGTPANITYRRDGRTQAAQVTPEASRPIMTLVRRDPAGVQSHARTLVIGDGDENQDVLIGEALPLTDLHLAIAPGIEAELSRIEDLRSCDGDDCRLPLLTEAFRWEGLNLASVDAQLGRYFGADSGVLVLSTGDELEGLQAGDVIRKVEGKPVASPREVMTALRGKPEDSRIEVEFLRDRQSRTTRVRLPKALPVRVPLPPSRSSPPMAPLPPMAFLSELPSTPGEPHTHRAMVLDPEGRTYEIDAEPLDPASSNTPSD